METVKSLAQILYYLALSIAGPLALIAYLKARKSDREEREYKTYDELDNRFFEYQKLALEYYDLDILDVPNNDPSLAFDSLFDNQGSRRNLSILDRVREQAADINRQVSNSDRIRLDARSARVTCASNNDRPLR